MEALAKCLSQRGTYSCESDKFMIVLSNHGILDDPGDAAYVIACLERYSGVEKSED